MVQPFSIIEKVSKESATRSNKTVSKSMSIYNEDARAMFGAMIFISTSHLKKSFIHSFIPVCLYDWLLYLNQPKIHYEPIQFRQ